VASEDNNIADICWQLFFFGIFIWWIGCGQAMHSLFLTYSIITHNKTSCYVWCDWGECFRFLVCKNSSCFTFLWAMSICLHTLRLALLTRSTRMNVYMQCIKIIST